MNKLIFLKNTASDVMGNNNKVKEALTVGYTRNKLETDINITTKLPGEMMNQAAEVYYSGFKQKFDGLLMIPRTREQALHILKESMDCSMGIYALDDGGNLVGLVGLGCKGRGFVKYRWRLLLQEFGLLGAILRKLIKFFEAPALRKDQLRIEGVVISEGAQGQGIGSALLHAVFERARRQGYKSVCLEVINTNPDARRLYHRLGFKDKGRVYFGLLTRQAGFTFIWRMEKNFSPTPKTMSPQSKGLPLKFQT